MDAGLWPYGRQVLRRTDLLVERQLNIDSRAVTFSLSRCCGRRKERIHHFRESTTMKKIALAILIAAFGAATPMIVTHAQSTADVAVARFKGAWTQTKGAVKEQWGKLTDDDMQEINGRREILVGKVQTRYAVSHEEAERQVAAFEAKHH
jgi:uncharacterized protein YjbJ (UPF0337 family)